MWTESLVKLESFTLQLVACCIIPDRLVHRFHFFESVNQNPIRLMVFPVFLHKAFMSLSSEVYFSISSGVGPCQHAAMIPYSLGEGRMHSQLTISPLQNALHCSTIISNRTLPSHCLSHTHTSPSTQFVLLLWCFRQQEGKKQSG